MIDHIIENYHESLIAIGLSYLGLLAIIAMFLPKNNPFKKAINWLFKK